jgi:tricorn protease-like protein
MENENDKLTVAGNAASELTDEKINSAIDEIEAFLIEDIILHHYIWKFIKYSPINAFSLSIKCYDMAGMSNYAVKTLLNANFKNAFCHWIDGDKGILTFLYSIS